ncbi:hypothetical protein DFH07DRAFT_370896 [Mycena maculata]|uniref:Uncharacterized protein n=1 Tax=Mycena maculata TaxID=230809 RepID=A0AAD7NKM3_9AGAR|nr:hypothetical protein DFH07DRAFT_370896 [Mycena maculata]
MDQLSVQSSQPRRRTLCTEDGREIVTPQLPFFDPPPSRRSPRAPGPMSIDVQLADRGQKIRPLPRIPIPPTPRSAPPAPPHQHSHSASMRPLPCLPESGVHFSVTPATPLPPPSPVVESSMYLSPPCPRPGPPRFASLSLRVQTSPDMVKFGASGPSPSTPPTPTLPEPPSPRTAQRNRVSKLRRHLGESVQIILDRPDKDNVLAELRHSGKEDAYPSITVEQVLDLDGGDSDASSEGEADVDYSWGIAPGRVSSTQKWVRERGKQRYTEDNFSKILKDLRRL